MLERNVLKLGKKRSAASLARLNPHMPTTVEVALKLSNKTCWVQCAFPRFQSEKERGKNPPLITIVACRDPNLVHAGRRRASWSHRDLQMLEHFQEFSKTTLNLSAHEKSCAEKYTRIQSVNLEVELLERGKNKENG